MSNSTHSTSSFLPSTIFLHKTSFRIQEKHLCVFVALVVLLCVSAPFALSAQTSAAQSVVVKLRTGVQPSAFISSLHAASIRTTQPFVQPHMQKRASVLQSKRLAELERYVVLHTDHSGGSLSAMLEQLRQRGDVESAELNTRHSLPNRMASMQQTTQVETTNEQWALEKIQAEQAWQKATGKGIVIGVIDTGLEFTHPEFAGQLWINPAEDSNNNGTFEPWSSSEVIDGVSGDLNGKDDDGNGYIDDVIGYDFVDQAILNIGDARMRDPIPADEHGHGTSVSGVIAARKDGIGITGVAYNSKIMVLRAFDATGNGEDDDFAAAVVYAALNGARIINMSFGDVYFPPILHDAIAFAHDMGCVVVASSGNAGGSSAHFPSNFSEVIAVGSTSRTDKLASTSTFGSLVDMVAPGVEIRTTDLRASYTTSSGTSFSAPHVAATAALLLEQRPTLTPEEVRGVLTASADNVDSTRGWDIHFGSGRLNAVAALDMLADATIVIAFPTIDYTVHTSTTTSIDITGSVFAPFFQSYTVDITDDERQGTWQNIASADEQIHNGILASLPVQSLHDGVYFLRIRIEQTNGNSLERRQRFALSSAPLTFTHLVPYTAWHNDRRAVVVSARTNQLTRFSVRFRPKGSQQPFREQSEVEHFTKNHTVVIGSEAQADIPYEAEAKAVTPDGTVLTQAFEFQRASTAFPWSDIFPLPYELPDGFLLNQTADLYGNGTAAVVVASQEGSRNVTRALTFNGKVFTVQDSLEALWIPRGMGDSNGDGIQEVFTQVGPRSALFQRSNAYSSPFAQRIFSDDTDTSNFWASGMADINNDGHPELIAHSHETYSAHTFAQGTYHAIAQTNHPLPPDFASYIATADFDGDGRVELCYGTTNAGFVIVEYRGGQFILEYQNANDNFNGNYFITALDIDSDGVKEILVCTYRDLATNNDREYDTPLWSFKLLRATTANAYEVVWQDYSYGVRPPNPYRSGVAAGDINGRPGDEMIIMAFPNAFVFTWDAQTKSIVPLWYYEGSISNTAIVYDFNGNGINEFGFNTGQATRFFEYDPKASQRPAPPTGLTGYAISATSASLQWNPSATAQSYEVYGGIVNTTTQLQRLATTAEPAVTITGLEESQEYLFVVVAMNPSLPERQSDRSNDALVFMHTPARPVSAVLANRRTIEVVFSHDIPQSVLQPSLFTVEGVGLPSTVVASGNRKALLLFAYPLPAGQHILSVASFRDRYQSPTPETQFALDIQPEEDKRELYLTNIRILSPTTLDVSFSEPVAAATAILPSAYHLAPFGRIAAAQPLQEKPETVRLSLGNELPLRSIGQNYVLTVRDVQAASGHPMTTGAGKALGFTLQNKNIAEAYAYPNPLRLSEGTSVYFGNLANGAEVTVRTLEGKILATLTENDGNGGVQWNCRATDGTLLESGVYVFSVRYTNANGTTTESEFKKLAVIR